MKKLALLLMALTIYTQSAIAADRGFVEAQVRYTLDQNGEKELSIEWDDNLQKGSITMGLELTNYRSDWHEGGMYIDSNTKFYFSYPELGTSCWAERVRGQIAPAYMSSEKSFLKFDITGPNCAIYLKVFKYFGVTSTFYNVDSIDKTGYTQVLRLLIVDAKK